MALCPTQWLSVGILSGIVFPSLGNPGRKFNSSSFDSWPELTPRLGNHTVKGAENIPNVVVCEDNDQPGTAQAE